MLKPWTRTEDHGETDLESYNVKNHALTIIFSAAYLFGNLSPVSQHFSF